jgi:DNA-binding MarR family transcriptional regulator
MSAAPQEPGSARQDDFGWHLGVVLRAYQNAVMAALGDIPHGPRGYQTLGAVIEGSHPSQLALATHLGIDRTVMTYLLDDLADAGLVERQQNPADRRQRKIVATAAGRRTFKRLHRRVEVAEESVLGSLSETERTTLRALLGRVAGTVHPVDPTLDACEVADEALARQSGSR